MPGPKITAELLLRSDMKDVVKEIEKGLSGAMHKHAQQVQKVVGQAWKDAVEMALGEGRSGKALKDFVQAGLVDAAEQYNALMRQGRVVEAQAQRELLDVRAKAFKREIDLRQRAFREMQDRQLETAEEAADRYKGGAEKMASILHGSFGGLLDVTRGGGRGLATRGRAMQDRAAQVQLAGGDPAQVAQMAKLGGQLAKIGTALAAVAAAIGVVVLMVKMFADLEAKIKDMNKALIGTAGAADFGLTHAEIVTGKLSERITEMRNNTTALNRNFMRFRVTFKEQQQILAQFNQAGLTYRRMNEEIEKGSSHMRSYSDATALAITYSRNLGIETGEIAQKMGEFAFDTGMTLQDVAEQFSVITREAALAGFATKRFYATIVEVTSGMGFYGVRIDETTKLLKTFDSLLGETVGTEAFKKLVGQYRDKGSQDRIRDLILKDQEFAQEQFGKAFERQIRSLSKTGDKLGLSEEDIRELLQMDEVAMSARLQELGAQPQQIQEFRRAQLVGRAAGGDMGAMVRAMPFAGAGFDVALGSKATEVFGGKRIDEVLRGLDAGTAGAAELAALEQVTGKSLDELEKLGALFTDMEGAMVNLRRIMATEPSERTEADQRLMTEYAKKLGLFIDDQTKTILKGESDESGRMIAGTGVQVKDALEAVSETTSLGEDAIKEQLTKDQEIATEISSNITGVSEILEQSTNRILERIYEAVMVIVNFLADDEDKRRRVAQTEGAHADQKKAQQEAEAQRENLIEAQKQMAKARESGDEEAIALAKANLKKAEDSAVLAEEHLQRTTATTQAVESMSDEARAGMGGGAREIMAAQAAAGVDISTQRQKAISSQLDRSTSHSERHFKILDTSTWGDGAVFEDMASDVAAWTTNVEELSAETRKRLHEEGVVGQIRGGEEGLEKAIAAATEAYNDAYDGFKDSRAAMIAYDAELQRYIGANVATDDEALEYQRKQDEKLQAIQSSLEEEDPLSALGLLAPSLFGKFAKANDLILPAGGGRPIITDERDTLFAARPGGPIAGAMAAGGGGGGGGRVQINIYGGDQKKVYDTVMRALKATGNA